MIHSVKTISRPEYEYTGSNQHGNRYKVKGYKDIRILTLSVLYDNDKDELWQFMTMCSSLGAAPTWSEVDKKQRMSIEMVAKN